MTSAEHRTWFRENIAWFEALPDSALSESVPACPGWRVDDVLNHLSYGLGVGYALAVAAPPDADPATVFAELRFPEKAARGPAARQEFHDRMWACAEVFARLDPDTPCWTYAGPGIARFWFRRGAIETWLHRVDVAEALDRSLRLDDRRAANAIEETISFALPMAMGIAGTPSARLAVDSSCLREPLTIGTGDTDVAIGGDGHDVLLALWGRHRAAVEVRGDVAHADEWFGLVETAFAGRS